MRPVTSLVVSDGDSDTDTVQEMTNRAIKIDAIEYIRASMSN